MFFRCLSKLIGEHHDDWDELIDPVLFSIRTAVQESTKCTPFFLMHGREARLPLEVEKSEEISSGQLGDVQVAIDRLETVRKDIFPQVSERIDKNQSKQKELYKQRKGLDKSSGIKKGDLVLRLNMVKRTKKGHKYENTWNGPYRVLEISKYGSCRLQTSESMTTGIVTVNINQLKIYNLPHSTKEQGPGLPGNYFLTKYGVYYCAQNCGIEGASSKGILSILYTTSKEWLKGGVQHPSNRPGDNTVYS